MKAKQPYDEDGRPSSHWHSAEAARANRAARYMHSEPCPACVYEGRKGAYIRVRYTKNEECVHCSREKAMRLHALVNGGAKFREPALPGMDPLYHFIRTGDLMPLTWDARAELELALDRVKEGKHRVTYTPCPRLGHLGVHDTMGRCVYCEDIKNRVSPRQAALRAGERWYTPETACIRCGTFSLRSTDNSKCRGCKPAPRPRGPLSARQVALRAGERWYTPDEACLHCHIKAERRVDNGQCKGCKPKTVPRDVPQTADAQLMREAPDLVITKDDARALGFKVYRTGEACNHGHVGWRYVSTQGCIACLKGA